jgi:uncharacterized membrane protein
VTTLAAGLLLFLGGHSVRIFADGWATRQAARLGRLPWMALYSLVALAGLVLVVHGYTAARLDPVVLWVPPAWTHHVAALLTLPAFVLVLAAYLPGTRIRAQVGHPMVLGVTLWALAHLTANGTVADLLLFGAFLAWSLADFAAARRRDRVSGRRPHVGAAWRDGVLVVAGIAAWVVFALWLHGPLFGVRPFG